MASGQLELLGGGAVPAHNQTGKFDIININSTVTLNDDFSLFKETNMTIRSGDTLIINGDVTFSLGSILTVETGGVLIINGDVENNNNSDQIVIDGLMDIDGNFEGGNKSEITGTGVVTGSGTFSLTGGGSNAGTIFGVGAGCTNCSYPTSPLPIELITFSGECKKDKSYFSWSTSSEINNSHFILERYNQENDDWIRLKEIKGAGYSSSIIDYSIAVEQQDGYFRLKQIDFDGAFTYSNPIVLTCKVPELDYVISPNPTLDNLHLKINNNNSSQYEVIITNLAGQLVSSFKMSNDYNLDVSQLEIGIYNVTIISDNQSKVLRFVKQ
jgi:hypothetical protein